MIGALLLLGAGFDGPPIVKFATPLPGSPLNAARHAERGGPVVHGSSLFLGSAGGQGLFELNRTDGSLRRTFEASASVESAPLVADGRVFFGDTAGATWCYRLADGEPCWAQPHRGTAPVLATPTLAKGQVIVTNVDDLVVALDAATGELTWRYQPKPDPTRSAELTLFATPAARVIGEHVAVGFSDGSVTALTIDTGEVEWSRRVGEGRYPDVVAEAVPSNTDLFVSGYWTPLVAIDIPSRTVRWRVDAGAAAPVTVLGQGLDATVFHPGTDGVVRAVAAVSGAERWQWDSGDGGALTEIIATEAGLFVGSSAGGLSLLDPASGTELWRWHEPFLLTGLSVAPVVEGRDLYVVTNAGMLYGLRAVR